MNNKIFYMAFLASALCLLSGCDFMKKKNEGQAEEVAAMEQEGEDISEPTVSEEPTEMDGAASDDTPQSADAYAQSPYSGDAPTT